MGSRRINLLSIYRPPPCATDAFFDDLTSICTNLEQCPGKLLVCGDFNIPGHLSGTVDVWLLDFLEENGYDQLVTGPTRRGATSDNLLDLVISHRDSLAVQVHDIINVPFSDHWLISFTADLPKIMARTVTYSYREYRKIDLS